MHPASPWKCDAPRFTVATHMCVCVCVCVCVCKVKCCVHMCDETVKQRNNETKHVFGEWLNLARWLLRVMCVCDVCDVRQTADKH